MRTRHETATVRRRPGPDRWHAGRWWVAVGLLLGNLVAGQGTVRAAESPAERPRGDWQVELRLVGTDTVSFDFHLSASGCVSITSPVPGRNQEERLFGPVFLGVGSHALRLPAGRVRGRGGALEWFAVRTAFLTAIGRAGAGERQFVHPMGLGWDSTQKELYVADTGNDRIVRLAADGRFIAQYGGFGMAFGDRREEREDSLSEPMDVAVGGFANLYVTDLDNDRVVEFDAYRRFTGTFFPKDRGQRLRRPCGIAIDRENSVWIVDGRGDRVVKVTPSGHKLLELGGFGWSQWQFQDPTQVATADDGRVLVADRGNRRIQIFDRLGQHLRVLSDGLQSPFGVAIDPDGLIWVTDDKLDAVLIFSDDGHRVGRIETTGAKKFRRPVDLVVLDDRVYVLDSGNHRICVFDRSGTRRRATWQGAEAVLH